MTRNGKTPQGRQSLRKGLRAHATAYVVLGIIGSLLVAVGVLGAPLVSVLLIGLLLLCPLLMWVPFRFEEESRERAQESFRRARHT